MFDIGFSELLLLAVVALVVLGPERLPRAARFAGLWVRRARAQWFSVKSELERELAAEELKRSLQEARQAAARLEETMRETGAEVEAKAREVEAATRREVESVRRGISGDPQPEAGAQAPGADGAAQAAASLGNDGAAAVDGKREADAAVGGPDVDTGTDTGSGHGDGSGENAADADVGRRSGQDPAGAERHADPGAPLQADLLDPAKPTDADDGQQR